ncbi:MAG: cytochrome c [Granulosicoccaceae bacterium]|jgi:mono/diheme cytochrome c family protein
MKYTVVLVITAASLLLQACNESPEPTASNKPVPELAKADIVYERKQDMAQIARGGKIYQQSCAECHGTQAEGAPNWHKPGPDGKYPPPALNGTAHAWHHPMAALKHTIREGTQAIGGSMPGWKDQLSEQDVEDVIAWFQAKWPDDLYQAWARNDARSRTAMQKEK